MPLSVAIITRNAVSQLEHCLASVAFADEVVVVDSGSTDGTVELATRRGARVVRKEWLGFGAQKQFAVDAASHEWVLCVDADECLAPSFAKPSSRSSRRRALLSTTFRAATAFWDAGSGMATAIPV